MARRHDGQREQVREWVAEQETSGQSVAAFARERGLSPWRLYDFKRRSRSALDQSATTSGFIRVKLSAAPPAAATMAVEIASGLRVHVPVGFDSDELRRLIGVLSSC